MNPEMEKTLEERVEETIDEQLEKLEDFFGMELKRPTVTLLNSRAEMDLLYGHQTEPWLVGNTNPKTGEISILREDRYETDSSHRREEFWGTLKHEIVHAAQGKIKEGEYRPVWFEEGVCQYLADQKKEGTPTEDLAKVNQFFEYQKNETRFYGVGYFWVKHLAEKYGDEKISQLVKLIKPGITPEKFQENFEKIYGFKLDDEYIKRTSEEKKSD